MTRTRNTLLYSAIGATVYLTVAAGTETALEVLILPAPFDRIAGLATIGLWLAYAIAQCLHLTLTAQAGIEARMVARFADLERRLHAHIDAWGVDALLANQRRHTAITTGKPRRRPSPHRTEPPPRPTLRSVN